MSTTVKRPLRWIACGFGLLLVMIAPLVYFLSSSTPEAEDPLMIGTLWSIAFVMLFIILIVQIVAPFFVEGSLFITAYTALFILLVAFFSLSADCLYGIFGSKGGPKRGKKPDNRASIFNFDILTGHRNANCGMAGVERIELSSKVLETSVLPLNQTPNVALLLSLPDKGRKNRRRYVSPSGTGASGIIPFSRDKAMARQESEGAFSCDSRKER